MRACLSPLVCFERGDTSLQLSGDVRSRLCSLERYVTPARLQVLRPYFCFVYGIASVQDQTSDLLIV